ncbi:secreted protein [Melampsora americana]|nr:secreted protein [Melampsora americana]
MHLSTLVSSLVLASAVSAVPNIADNVARLASRSPSEQQAGIHQKSVKMQCAIGCGALGVPLNPGLGFQQPMIFNNGPGIGNFAAFGTACANTVGLWQGAPFQLVQTQFSMMIVSMSTLMAPFQSGCGAFCTSAIGPVFLQTITQVILQVQSLVQIIWTQFQAQIALFATQFQSLAIFFQGVIAIGMSMNVPIQQVFAGQFNMGLFQNCGLVFNGGIPGFGGFGGVGGAVGIGAIAGVQGGFGGVGGFGGLGGVGAIGGAGGAGGLGGINPSFLFGHVGLLGQVINPLVSLLQPVTNGLGSLLHNVGLGVGGLLGGNLL